MTLPLPDFMTLRRPDVASPVVVNVPHAGTDLPTDVRPSIASDDRATLIDVDWAVDHLFRHADRAGATFLSTSISRFAVDLNRNHNHVHPDNIAFEWPHEPDGTYGRRGLFWFENTLGTTIIDHPLTRAEVDARMAYYTPYHEVLAGTLDAIRGQHGVVVLIDGHSMPSVGRHGHSDEGVRRKDMVLGNVHGASCAPQLGDTVASVLRGAGYDVGFNVPYSGGFDTRHYGRPAQAMHALQIEIARGVYMDEDALTLRQPAADALSDVLEDVVRAVVALAAEGL